MSRISIAILTLVPFAVSSFVSASDWPQYRGPGRDGKVVEDGLLESWTESEPIEAWRRPIGIGFSSVSVADGRLFTMEEVDFEEAVLAIDAATGETLWRVVVGNNDPEAEEFFPGGGPRTTPTIAGDVLYTVTSHARMLAMSTESGEILWERNLLDYGPVPRYGYSASPLVDEGRLLILVGDRKKQPGVVALDRATGEVLWEALDGPAGYASPIIAEIGGVKQYVFSTFVSILGLSTDGRVLWTHDTGPKIALPMPVFVAPDGVFAATADDQFGGMMIRVTADADGFQTEEVWKERLMRNHFNTSVLIDGHLYGFDNATFRCLDAATGEKKWAKRGFGKGSIAAAGDLLYVLSDDGLIALVHANPEAYVEAGRRQIMEGRSWTAPSLANGQLFMRDFDELVSLDVRGASTSAAALAAPTPAPAPTTNPAPATVTVGPDELTADQVVAKHIEARGGAEGWAEVEALELEGVYAAFSEQSDFRMIRRRGDEYRLDFEMLGAPAIRARDAEHSWWQHILLQPEPERVTEGVYKPMLERESLFGPLLLDAEGRGIEVTLVGSGEIDGRPTIDLEVTLPGGTTEIWHLDTQTYLEVAVDSQVHDYTQAEGPIDQRAFYSDFREVGGIVLPFRVDLEFGARLEEMRVSSAEVNPEIDPQYLEAPPAPPVEEAAEDTGEDS